MEIVLASDNRHKRDELAAALAPHHLLTAQECGAGCDFVENRSTFMENSLGKARSVFERVRKPVLADDSGLCVTALDGRPGVFSKRYGSKDGKKLLSDAEKNRLLLNEMAGEQERDAFFVCALVLLLSDQRLWLVQESCAGVIAEKALGANGFGYDPLFFIPEKNKTLAQLSPSEKNKISHRGLAVRALRRLLG